MEPQHHAAQARFLLDALENDLVIANPQLRSEVLWGAATQMVKAVAKAHGIPNANHRELFRAVRWVGTNLAQDPDLLRQFGRIEQLHVNFYDGEMSADEINDRQCVAKEFVATMQRILGNP